MLTLRHIFSRYVSVWLTVQLTLYLSVYISSVGLSTVCRLYVSLFVCCLSSTVYMPVCLLYVDCLSVYVVYCLCVCMVHVSLLSASISVSVFMNYYTTNREFDHWINSFHKFYSHVCDLVNSLRKYAT